MDYEIHVTVKTFNIPKFQKVCEEIGVKPVILDLQTNSGSIEDVMTSSKFNGDDDSVIDELDNIVESLLDEGFDVIRQKIETVPWHPSSKLSSEDFSKEGLYYESHIPLFLRPGEESKLDIFKKTFPDLHLSKNKFKIYENGSSIQMCTYRRYDLDRKEFEKHVTGLCNYILFKGFSLKRKPDIELCIYDTNVNHDSAWLNS